MLKNNNCLLSSISPFPSVFWWKKALSYKEVCFDAFEHYQKMTGRNRYHLAGPQGKQLLSIPLRGGRNQRLPIAQVYIDNQSNWQKTHWRTILSFYGRAPFFEFYADEIKMFFNQPTDEMKLMDWCFSGVEKVFELLGVNMVLTQTETFQLNYPEEIVDIRVSNLKNLKKDNSGQPYHQVFQDRTGFITDCAILDLMFCMGPLAKEWLTENNLG